ncbi:putative dehydrogenase [Niallia nealsonii AAU1]|nr:putative dehydrogenase [Niallia nealsonii AAU1]
MTKYNWGIIGAGVIAHEMGKALAKKHGEIYAVYSTTFSNTQAYSEKFPVKKVYSTANDFFADEEIDIVYIATPHNSHYELIKRALLNNKHVFCEKAITVNEKQLEECVTIAQERGLTICDGVTLFHMPIYKELKKRIDAKKLGKVKMIQVNFGSYKEYDVNNRFFSKDLAGGALLDIGVYAVSFARYFMSSKPDVVLTTAEFFETGVDESSGIVLKNSEGELATISLTMRAKQPKRGLIACENGYIEIYEFPRADQAYIHNWIEQREEVLSIGKSENALIYEVEDMEDYITNHTGQNNLAYIRDTMSILTTIRNEWRLYYPFE